MNKHYWIFPSYACKPHDRRWVYLGQHADPQAALESCEFRNTMARRVVIRENANHWNVYPVSCAVLTMDDRWQLRCQELPSDHSQEPDSDLWACSRGKECVLCNGGKEEVQKDFLDSDPDWSWRCILPDGSLFPPLTQAACASKSEIMRALNSVKLVPATYLTKGS